MHIPEEGAHITFYIQMPTSWSKKKKALYLGTYHKQKPDIDNLGKAIFDSVLKDDSGISDIRMTKRWSEIGYIEIV